jgi:hypothetical protein
VANTEQVVDDLKALVAGREMSCLPKYIQQFTVWKDELTVYTAPAGVVPVMSFLIGLTTGARRGPEAGKTRFG